jgi:Xaa-Pro aminopeptidase
VDRGAARGRRDRLSAIRSILRDVSTQSDLLVERTGRLRARLAADGLDALIITGPASVRWLTGYTGSNGLCVVTSDEQRFVTDFRYGANVAHLRASWDVQIVDQNLIGVLGLNLPQFVGNARRVGFESSRLTYASWAMLDEGTRDGAIELVGTKDVVEDVRAVKSADEIELIRAGAEINDRVYEWLSSEGLDGKAERDWVHAISDRMRELGADGPAFPSIVAGGANGASPHAVPGHDVIERNTLVVVDLGALVGGYCSDCTRTFATGEGVSEQAREVYALVLEAQLAGLEAVQAGPNGREVDAVARELIDRAGFGEHFGHGLGHGVGLEIHEAPRLSRTAGEEPLVAGSVVTVEPGVYLPDVLGVRIEDLTVVRDGGRDVLTDGLSKELTVVS